jgi:hypothetical protein
MLKKVAAVTAVTAGLMMVGAPAFAGVPGGHNPGGKGDKVSQIGLVNVNDVDILRNVNAVVGACGNNVSVVGVTVPVLSPSPTKGCAAGGIKDDSQD